MAGLRPLHKRARAGGNQAYSEAIGAEELRELQVDGALEELQLDQVLEAHAELGGGPSAGAPQHRQVLDPDWNIVPCRHMAVHAIGRHLVGDANIRNVLRMSGRPSRFLGLITNPSISPGA